MKSRREEVIEEIISYFQTMHQIIDIPEYNNAMIAGQYIMDAIKQYELTLSEIEKILREMSSRVYLIGLPLSFFKNKQLILKLPYPKKGLEYGLWLPYPKKDLEYGLWIEVNGFGAMNRIIERNHLTDIDRSLEKTGFICLKET